jgi:uncharacterized protein YdcH (DUF465 family)
MTHTPHELAEEFPDKTDQIHSLKASDAHFARLADDYHAVNREIHRLETRVETASDVYEEELRKKRVKLKDDIAAILARK